MSITESTIEKKLQAATNSQDSIQTLSLWLLHHRAHHEKIVATWMKVLKKAKPTQRLTLVYVANDVIQNSKRKNVSHFRETFAGVLRDATPLVRDEQIRASVSRVFNIWGERSIYDSEFISELQTILDNEKTQLVAPPKFLTEFKCEVVIEKLRSVAKHVVDSTAKMATVNINKLNATNAEIVQKLKDRSHGQQFSTEFEESTRGLEDLIKSLSKEVEQRNKLIELLEQSGAYYETQQKEAKIVANAYKNFGTRVKSQQKKLSELMETFPEPSPLPSPCADAPSPTNSDLEAELILPAEMRMDDSSISSKGIADVNDLISPLTSLSGEPIPILSSFFNQDQRKMPSWLETFTKGSTQQVTESTKASDTGSLDSRLSNLLQNIPNLPSSLQDTLLNSSANTENSPKARSMIPKRGISHSSMAVDSTSSKEEYSGQNTPLQDEDTSAPLGSSFFGRLTGVPKAPQSQKDMLKGLTNFIQTASSKDKSFKVQTPAPTSPWPPRSVDEPLNKVSSFFSQITAPQSSFISSPPLFHSPEVKTSKKEGTPLSLPETILSTLHGQPAFSTQTSAVEDIHKNLSFIPTLVPSTPTGSHFNYESKSQYEEYDPGTQNYDIDMDVASEESNECETSLHSDSPDKEASQDMLPGMYGSRQSTLITLVTDSCLPTGAVQADDNQDVDKDYSSSQMYREKPWPAVNALSLNIDIPGIVANSTGSDIKAIDTPTMVSPPPPLAVDQDIRPNGRGRIYPEDWSHSKIETVQSFRSPEEKPVENDWPVHSTDNQQPFFNRPRPNYMLQGYPTIKPQYPPQRYGPPNVWDGRKQQYPGYNRGYQQPRFPSFAARGRGWKNNRYPY